MVRCPLCPTCVAIPIPEGMTKSELAERMPDACHVCGTAYDRTVPEGDLAWGLDWSALGK